MSEPPTIQPSDNHLPTGYLLIAELDPRVSLLRQISDGQLVAAKRCPTRETRCETRLRQESELLARLKHPNIATRLDWLDAPQPLLLTAYIAAATLAQRYSDQPAENAKQRLAPIGDLSSEQVHRSMSPRMKYKLARIVMMSGT